MYDPNDSNDITEVNDGGAVGDGSAVNTFDASKARAFASGAKNGGETVLRRVWDDYDPDEKPDPKRPFSLRLNSYDKAIAKQLAAWRNTSMQQAIVDVLREAALEAIKKEETKKPKKRKTA
jgi:hypothetical protein